MRILTGRKTNKTSIWAQVFWRVCCMSHYIYHVTFCGYAYDSQPKLWNVCRYFLLMIIAEVGLPGYFLHLEGCACIVLTTFWLNTSRLHVSFWLCSKSWVNVYCVLKEGKLTFYKDARNHNTTYNEEPPVDLSNCSFDPSMGYKKKKNVFILQ